MNKRKLWIPVLAGLMIGQLFAESERPFKVINTVRFGYDDNINHNMSNEKSSFVSDTVDLSFRAALSDRTDLMVRSQLNLLDDSGGNKIYPNLYAMLNHSVSPRMLLRLSEYYRSGESNAKNNSSTARDSYFYNKADASADYVLTRKDHLEGSVSHEIQRYSEEKAYDWTTVQVGTTWKRDIIMQRTYSTVNLDERWTKYNITNNSFKATDLTVGLNHTFNQEWQGYFTGGVTYKCPDYPDSTNTNGNALSPKASAGLVYTPSPRTRITTDFSYGFFESESTNHGGRTTAELRFGVQHDITAKLMAQATARFAKTDYSAKDDVHGNNTSYQEDRMDLEFRLNYKLNRINFLELGLKHVEDDFSNGGSWRDNRVDVGWRVELN